MSTYKKRTVCPYDCPDACGMVAVTDGKRILSVKGDDLHPVTKGFVCRKMQHYEKDIHSPSRILTPFKRIGKKGDPGSFVPISWEEAIKGICDKWKELIRCYGSDCILPYSYAGTMGVIQRHCGEAFFAKLGAAKLNRTICSSAKGAGITQVMGTYCDLDASQLSDSDLIILWSSNPLVNRIHVVPMIKEAKKKGAKVLLIDVHKNRSSSLCDDVILVRPGTDGALILTLMNELEQNDGLDMDTITNKTVGFEKLQAEYHNWDSTRCEEVTGVSREQLHMLATLIIQAKKPILIGGSGMSRYTNGASAFRLLSCLTVLSGMWKRGGGTCGMSGSSNFIQKQMVTRPDWTSDQAQEINMNQLGTALLKKKHPIMSLYVYHSNPAVMTPDQQTVIKGLLREDLFVVVHDRFFTDTALYADYVLPAAFSVEQDDFFTSYGYYHMQVSEKIIPPAGESRSNWDTFRLLAAGMGYTDEYFQLSEREMLDRFLDLENQIPEERTILFDITPEQKKQLKEGFPVLVPQPEPGIPRTSDGKYHLDFNGIFYHPLEDHKYPLRLVMNHSVWSLNSNFSCRKDLMEKRGPLTIRMSPEDAKARNLKDGDVATARNDYGQITVCIHITDSVPAGTVIAEGVYQKAWTFGNGNFSSLLSPILTDCGAASTLNTQTVEIYS